MFVTSLYSIGYDKPFQYSVDSKYNSTKVICPDGISPQLVLVERTGIPFSLRKYVPITHILFAYVLSVHYTQSDFIHTTVSLELSTFHGQTVENNSVNAYGRLSWTVNI